MAIKTKVQLQTYNDTYINTNGIQAITGDIVNTFNYDILDSLAFLTDVPTILPVITMYPLHIGMSGIVATQFSVIGAYNNLISGVIGSISLGQSIDRQHLSFEVNSISGSGNVTITGAKIDETTGVITGGHTEDLAVSATKNYQTSAKFVEVSTINIPAGITAINYDIYTLGYYDAGNTSITLEGYRWDVIPDGTTPDIRMRIRKVTDNGDGTWQFTTLEDFGFDSVAGGGQYYDHLRSGLGDRSYTCTYQIATSNDGINFKQGDFDTYFTSDQNVIDGTLDEGLIVDFLGEPSGGISQIDHCTLTLVFESESTT